MFNFKNIYFISFKFQQYLYSYSYSYYFNLQCIKFFPQKFFKYSFQKENYFYTFKILHLHDNCINL